MRLIDADEMAVQESEAYMKVNAREYVSPVTLGINSVVHRKIQQLIADTPTIDAVPVVRCKDCKWSSQSGLCNLYISFTPSMKPDDFCSYGERRDNDAKAD